MNIFEDISLNFHGIGYNILKCVGILEFGLLTAEDGGKSEGFARNYADGFNGNKGVSLVVSPMM